MLESRFSLLSKPVTRYAGVWYAFAAAMGFLWLSTKPLTSGLIAHIFRSVYLGMLSGFVFLSH